MTDTVEANLALTRRLYDLWNGKGVEAMVAHMWAPDVVFHEAPELPDADVFWGAAAVAARMEELIEVGGHFQVKLRSIEGRGDCVLAGFDLSAEGAWQRRPGNGTVLPCSSVWRGPVA